MRPLKLRFFGIGSYAREQELDFAQGLEEHGIFLIHGATGAGKTTILDALTYALYGEASGRSRDKSASLRADRAPAEEATWAELVFSLGSERYRVYRTLRHESPTRKAPIPAKGMLYRVDGETETLLEGSPKAVTQRVTELIGIDHDQFCQVVLLPQGDFQRFLVANSQERSGILQKLFRTERYSEIEERLKKRSAALEREAKRLLETERLLLEQAGCETKDALKAARLAGAGEIRAQGERVLAAQRENERAQAALAAGQALAARFAERDARADELAKKRALLPVQQEWRERLEEAKRAVLPMERESRARDLCKEAEQRADFARRAQAAEQAAVRAEKEAQRALTAEQAREAERAALREERARLARLQRTAEAYGKAAREQQAANRAAIGAQECVAKLAKEAEKARAGEARLAEQMAHLAGAAEGRALIEARVRELMQQAALAEKIGRLSLDVQRAEAHLRGREQEAERAEREAKAREVQAGRLRVLYRMSAAFSLAETLQEGEPCTVCGATHHPQLAAREGIVPTRAELDAAEAEEGVSRERAARAREARVQAAGAAETARRLLADAKGAWQEGAIEDAAARKTALQEAKGALDKARLDEAARAEAEEAHAAAKAARARLAAELAAAQETASAARARDGAASGRLAEIEANLPEALRAEGALGARLEETTRRLARLEEALQRAQAAEAAAKAEAARRRAQGEGAAEEAERARAAQGAAEESFQLALSQSHLSREAYERTARDPKWSRASTRARVEARLAAFAEEYAAAERAARDAEQAVAGAARPDVAALAGAAEKASEGLLAEAAEAARLEARQAQLERLERKIARGEAAHEKLDRAYRLARSLAAVAGGEHGVHFQTYVQRSIFYEVMDAANARLAIMSRQRFQLVMGELGQDQRKGRGWEGLELAVLDAETGKPRGVRTLSGGESFLASLALALGLADVVQAYAGGVRLDTMFIDEGFGSLDMETLDTAIEALIALQKDGARLVGIISHVAELEERIPARLEVERGANGSRAYFAIGARED